MVFFAGYSHSIIGSASWYDTGRRLMLRLALVDLKCTNFDFADELTLVLGFNLVRWFWFCFWRCLWSCFNAMVRVLKTFLVALFPGSSRKGSGELLFSGLGDCWGALFLVNALYHSVFEVEFPLWGNVAELLWLKILRLVCGSQFSLLFSVSLRLWIL